MTDDHCEFFAKVHIAPDAPIHGDKLIPRYGASVRKSGHLYPGFVLWSDRPLGRGDKGVLRIVVIGTSMTVGEEFELLTGVRVFTQSGIVTEVIEKSAG